MGKNIYNYTLKNCVYLNLLLETDDCGRSDEI